MTREEELSHLANALPSHFQFYHLGEVEMTPLLNSFADTTSIAYRLSGEITALLVLSFAKELDMSIYSEVGNIIASRLVTQLSEEGIDVTISSPKHLDPKQIKLLLGNKESIIRRTYAHLLKNSVIPLEATIFAASQEGIGYA